MARRAMAVDEVECFFVDDGFDDFGECLTYQRGDLRLVPTLRESQRRLAYLFHPGFVGPEVTEHQLPIQRSQHEPTRDIASVVQWPAERHERGFCDHRLVEVEEGSLHAFTICARGTD